MNLVVFSGPPSSGKTSVIIKTIDALKQQSIKVGVVKFDCLYTDDDALYERAGVPVRKGLSGALCPDHFFVSNIEEVVKWGTDNDLDLLITESAGLCNRCSPYIKEIKGVCVIDNLSGINTPKKIKGCRYSNNHKGRYSIPGREGSFCIKGKFSKSDCHNYACKWTYWPGNL